MTEHKPLDEAVPAAEPDQREKAKRRIRSPRAWFVAKSPFKKGLLSAIALFLVVVLYSISVALLAPGTDPVSARLAEWGRNHGLGALVTLAENAQYNLDKPKVGGTLDSSQKSLISKTVTPQATSIPSIVQPTLPGEGDLKTVVSKDGQPAIQIAYIRPDKQHTSYLAAVALMNSSLVSFVQHPGFSEPGNAARLSSTDLLAGSDLSNLAATFNSAFKLKDSQGGYYQNGVMVKPLVDGKASLVIYKDGHADIGAWGSELTMRPDVVSVRQNLSPLIDGGEISTSIKKNVFVNWGFTVKNSYYVWRSGVGVTASGDIVYAAGNALSVASMANVLKAAGAVRAMELDINQEWISYMYYTPDATTGAPTPTKLLGFTRPGNRYFNPSSRDFFAVYLR